jgi:peptide chain release factor 2
VRTGYESTNPEAVLNGQLDGFLKAFLMISGQKESSNEL